MKLKRLKKGTALLLALAIAALPTVKSFAETNDTEAEGSMVNDASDVNKVSGQAIEGDSDSTLSESVNALETERTISYSYYECECTDTDVLVGDSYYISKDEAIYYYAEFYYDGDPSDGFCDEGYCDIEDISISGSAEYDLEEEGGEYVITPRSTGELTVTLYYTPSSEFEDTVYNGEYSFTINAVDELTKYSVEIEKDTTYILPGETATFIATLKYRTETSEGDYYSGEYDGEATYQWTLHDDNEAIDSTSDNGSTFSVTAKDSFTYDSSVWVELEVYDTDGTLLCTGDTSDQKVTACNEYYNVAVSQSLYYVDVYSSVDVEAELQCHTVEGDTVITSGVSFYLVYVGCQYYSYDGDIDIDVEDILQTDGLTVTVIDYLSGISGFKAYYYVQAAIDGNAVDAETAYVNIAVNAPTVYEYYFSKENEEWPVNTEYSISKEDSIDCYVEAHDEGETITSNLDISVTAVTAVTEAGESLDVQLVNGYYVFTPTAEGDVTVTLYYNPADGDDDNNGQYSYTLSVISEKLEAPSGISVSRTTSGVKVKWNEVTGAAKYRVLRRTADSSWEQVGDTTSTSYTDTTAKNGTKYYYTVCCISSDGTVVTSDYDETGKGITYYKYAKPTLSAISNTTSGIKVTWEKVSGASQYRVYRKTADGSWKKLADTLSASYTDTTAKSGTTYYYTVRCLNSSGTAVSSYNSTGLSIKYLKAGKISSLKNTSKGITVKWSKVTGAKGYYVYRKTSGGSFKKIATITNGSTTSYSDTSVKSKNGKTYIYAVKPYSGSTKGSYTSKTTVRLTIPSLSSVKNSSSKKITVKWSKVSSVTGYQIQYSTDSDFESGNKTVTIKGASSVNKTISSLTKGKKYYVRIRTYKTVDGTKYYSAWSSKKSVTISK